VSARGIRDAFDLARRTLGISERTCPGCGGLHSRSLSMVIVKTGTDPRKCPACGLTLDHKGRAVGYLGPDSRVVLTVIMLPELPEHLMI